MLSLPLILCLNACIYANAFKTVSSMYILNEFEKIKYDEKMGVKLKPSNSQCYVTIDSQIKPQIHIHNIVVVNKHK